MRAGRVSGSIAKDRLEQMLLSEKMQSSPEMMAQMKRELGCVVRKYMNTEHASIEIQLQLTEKTKQGAEYVKTIQIKGL